MTLTSGVDRDVFHIVFALKQKSTDISDPLHLDKLLCGIIIATTDTWTMAEIGCSAGSLLKSLEVPQFTFVSGTVTLRCVYDMGSSKLYSLKWYHNNTEFYRYVPTERNGPEVSRDARHVTLSLSRLTSAATGAYRCEVLAEHPSFRTESMQSYMTVLSLAKDEIVYQP
ncbi:hypothetical protein HAZT_HAZT004169 [Hyalella azteca]|uniref:Ig-like domain-containing protein n=1 Tax=Hyalella azteca TaxID=294128 RepID=A0A6A0H7C8_HYAAZ|nr:hypothetical protein HAZT_HAZT004169 [Hyalella azteca]